MPGRFAFRIFLNAVLQGFLGESLKSLRPSEANVSMFADLLSLYELGHFEAELSRLRVYVPSGVRYHGAIFRFPDRLRTPLARVKPVSRLIHVANVPNVAVAISVRNHY